MTPVGAMCAVHVGEAAVATCERCGNFMCLQCSAGRTSTKCPTCLAATSTSTFPWGPDAPFDTLWSHASAAWRRELGMLVLATLVWGAFTMGGSMVGGLLTSVVNAIAGLGTKDAGVAYAVASAAVGQVIGTLVGAVVQAFALTGFYRVLMDVLLGRTVDLGRMFSHAFLMPRMVALQVIMAVLFTLPMLAIFGVSILWSVAGAGITLDRLDANELANLLPRFMGNFALSMLIIMVLAIVVMPVTIFSVPELMVGDCGPFEAITRAWKLGSGQRLRLLGYGFVSGAVTFVGLIACFIGVLPALPLAYMVLLVLFLALRNGSGLPAPKFD